MGRLKIAVCGYRSWALEIIEKIKNHPDILSMIIIEGKDDYDKKINSLPEDLDFLLFLGWSWIIPPEITNKYLCLGIHPSDLPFYRGGSPLQHQIINGALKSKLSLITLGDKLDAGEIWLKEDLNLTGNNMTEVFKNISNSSITLLEKFIKQFPHVKPGKQNISEGTFFKRRKEEESKITKDQFQKMSSLELYNFIRCLTDPYPNAYLEDEKGNKLVFKEVIYIPKIK